jgi:hypothetical protein
LPGPGPGGTVGGMLLAADYPFLEIIGTILVFFWWLVWIWLLVLIMGDVFGREDLSGWAKAGWVVFCVVLPFIGVLTYMIVHDKDFTRRRQEREVGRHVPRAPAGTDAPG